MPKRIIFFAIALVVGSFFQTEQAFALVFPQYVETRVVGGAGIDAGQAIKADSQGNLFVFGFFSQGAIDFNPGEGVDNFTNEFTTYDLFLTKYNVDGTYAWTKTWGGSETHNSYDLSFDSDDNIYLATEFAGTVDFDPGEGVDSRTSAGSVDIALIKLNVDGSYAWTKTMGSTSHDRLQTIRIASDGDIYTAGKFQLTVDFDPGEGVDNHTSVGSYDMFFTKFNADGSYAWTKTWGSTGSGDSVNKIAIDADDNIYLVGCFNNTTDFDPGEGVDNKISNGSNDTFLTRYNSDDTYAWTKAWGGSANDFGFSVNISPGGDIYVTGSYQLTVDLDPSLEGVNNVTSAGSEDTYVSKFQTDGTYDFSYVWGEAGMDGLYSLSFDAENNWYTGGIFSGPIDFDPGVDTDIISPVGPHDMFFSIFDENDNYLMTKTFGSLSLTETTWWDESLGSVFVSGNNLYLTGYYSGTADFDPEDTTDEYTSVGDRDIFYTTYNLVFSPALSTSSSTAIAQTGATLNGEITNTGGGNITARGFNYGLTDSYGTTVTESSGPYSTGAFTVTFSDLNCGTTYHYRAFATNAAETVYGSDASFTTNDCPSSSGSRARPKSVATETNDILPVTPDAPTDKPVCMISLTLRRGSTGDQVKCLQTKLNILSDGIFGPITKAAVVLFQKAHSLAPDGIVGPITRGEINKN